MNHQPKVLIIAGPTGSGKTSLAEELCTDHLTGAMINADAAQFYTPLQIGTAKPFWQNYPFKTYLFDQMDTPNNIDAQFFVDQSIKVINECKAYNHTPVIVGGTFFYIKSLFFSLITPSQENKNYQQLPLFESSLDAWEYLKKIDSRRAQDLHPHDYYRIKRALELWQKTGLPPSQLKPQFMPQVNPFFVYIMPDRLELHRRITNRSQKMLELDGWIEEAERLIDSPWEKFIIQKGFIGYDLLFEWIRSGKSKPLKTVQEKIIVQTWKYAKRQMAFWRSFMEQLDQNQATYSLISFSSSSKEKIKEVAQQWKKFSIEK